MRLAAPAAARRPRPGCALTTAVPDAPQGQTYHTYNFKAEPSGESKDSWRELTQLLWKSTKRVGCAIKNCLIPSAQAKYGYDQLVCRYDPPGNVAGQYLANVFAP